MSETEHGIYFVEEIAKGIYKFYEQRNASIYLVTGKDTEYSYNGWKVICK